MNEFDQKLSDIIYSESLDMVEQIKQAFADAGYIPSNLGKTLYAMPKGKDLARELAGLDQIIDDSTNTIELSSPMMTGQEWYDRFKKELPKITSNPNDIIKAAKRAAGLEN